MIPDVLFQKFPFERIHLRNHDHEVQREKRRTSPVLGAFFHLSNQRFDVCVLSSRIPSPTISSKIPVPVSAASKGAFRFFTADDRPTVSTQLTSVPASTQATKQLSPFTPITPSKTLLTSKKSSSSAGNTPSARVRRAHIPSSDEESIDENLKEEELKLKLKEQKRHGRQTGELLNKLHENYEELLEKYAQAENTIDQLRFQPKIIGDSSPPSNASEVSRTAVISSITSFSARSRV